MSGEAPNAGAGEPDFSEFDHYWDGVLDFPLGHPTMLALEVQLPWTKLVLAGKKTVETRTYPFPTELLGVSLLLLESDAFKPGVSAVPDTIEEGRAGLRVVGEIVIKACFRYHSKAEWDADTARHQISRKTGYVWRTDVPLYGWTIGARREFPRARHVPNLTRVKRSLFRVAQADADRWVQQWDIGDLHAPAPLPRPAPLKGVALKVRKPKIFSRTAPSDKPSSVVVGANEEGKGANKEEGKGGNKEEGKGGNKEEGKGGNNEGGKGAAAGGLAALLNKTESHASAVGKEVVSHALESMSAIKREVAHAEAQGAAKARTLGAKVMERQGSNRKVEVDRAQLRTLQLATMLPPDFLPFLEQAARDGLSEGMVRHRLREFMPAVAKAVIQKQAQANQLEVEGLPEDLLNAPRDLFALSGSVQVINFECSALGWFPSITLSNTVLTSGKYYYEVELVEFEPERMVVGLFGWGNTLFTAHSEDGLGAGCDEHSWAIDARRAQKFHTKGESTLQNAKTQAKNRPYGQSLKSGNVLGLAADVDARKLYYSLDGKWDEPFGLAFEDIEVAGGLRPVITMTANIRLVLNFGQRAFAFDPPSDEFQPVSTEPIIEHGILREQAPVNHTSSTRRDYMRTLEEMIGPKISTDWKAEIFQLTGRSLEDRLSDPAYKKRHAECMGNGWSEDEAVMLVAGVNYSARLGGAIKDHKTDYVAFTYSFYEMLTTRALEAKHAAHDGFYYRPLSDLVQTNANWLDVDKPDDTGFKGFTSNEPIIVYPDKVYGVKGAQLLVDHSKNEYDVKLADESGARPVEGALVRFANAQRDDTGLHSPVPLDAFNFVFPPLTLFRVEEEHEWVEIEGKKVEGFRMLTVKPTYLISPSLTNINTTASKFSNNVTYLGYGSRNEYVRGIEEILDDPPLTMQEEFLRDDTWQVFVPSEKVMVTHSAKQEWDYVMGRAQTARTHTGLRDPGDNNKLTVEGFRQRINKHIRDCGGAEALELSLDETIAVRLYSGPAFKPINQFLREVANLSPEWRRRIAHNTEFTYSSTVAAIYSAVRKLSQVPSGDLTHATLYRGVRGELPKSFFRPDEMGLICATDFGFVSTSIHRETPIDYLDGEQNVLWELQCREEDVAHHRGGDISLLSQYPEEKEVLFPPLTMLQVELRDKPLGEGKEAFERFEIERNVEFDKPGGKVRYDQIKVVPFFV